jgi:hypothetical protein
MNIFEQVALALQALRHTLLAMRAPRLWVPWLALGAVQLGVVVALWHFAHPALSWLMAPILRRVAGEDALHYPGAFEVLPRLYDRADLVIGALLGSVAIGSATGLFADHFHGLPARVGSRLATAVRRAPALVLVQLPFNVLVFGLTVMTAPWLESHAGGRLAAVAGPLLTGVSLVLQAAFFYVAARVMIAGDGAAAALRGVPATWARGLVPALVVSALTLLLLLPLDWLAGHEGLVVSRGRPELVGWLTVLRLIAGLVNWFLLSGSATLLYLSLLHRREDAA